MHLCNHDIRLHTLSDFSVIRKYELTWPILFFFHLPLICRQSEMVYPKYRPGRLKLSHGILWNHVKTDASASILVLYTNTLPHRNFTTALVVPSAVSMLSVHFVREVGEIFDVRFKAILNYRFHARKLLRQRKIPEIPCTKNLWVRADHRRTL